MVWYSLIGRLHVLYATLDDELDLANVLGVLLEEPADELEVGKRRVADGGLAVERRGRPRGGAGVGGGLHCRKGLGLGRRGRRPGELHQAETGVSVMGAWRGERRTRRDQPACRQE